MHSASIKHLTGQASTRGMVKKNPNIFSTGIQEPHPYQSGVVQILSPTFGRNGIQNNNASVPNPRFPITSSNTRHVNNRSRGL